MRLANAWFGSMAVWVGTTFLTVTILHELNVSPLISIPISVLAGPIAGTATWMRVEPAPSSCGSQALTNVHNKEKECQ